MEEENLNNWKLGLFYYNPKDPLFFVRKLNHTGWTLNFGNKNLYALLICMGVIIYFLYQ